MIPKLRDFEIEVEQNHLLLSCKRKAKDLEFFHGPTLPVRCAIIIAKFVFMKNRIGKYWFIETETNIRVTYRFSFSDLITNRIPVLGVFFGALFLYISAHNFSKDKIFTFDFVFMFLTGLILLAYFGYIIALTFWKSRRGALEINKSARTVVVRDFLKSEIIEFKDVVSVFYEISDNSRLKEKYGTLKIKKKNNEIVDCLIINSSEFIDTEGADLNLIQTARLIRDKVIAILKE